jgi:hypothetical protein
MDHRTTETDWQSLYEAETRISAKQAAKIVQLRAQVAHARTGFESIQKATIGGRVCDDVAWFDTITTLHDFCCQMIDRLDTTSETGAM